MAARDNKTGIFILEGLNALSLAFYFLFIFFFMQKKFGFGNMENLLLGGLAGFVYMIASYICGRIARRAGYLRILVIAFGVVTIALLVGSQLQSVTGHLVVVCVAVAGIGFVWTPLQALACQHEPAHRVQRMVGLYNVIWATLVAIGYFAGGAMFEAWNLSIFIVTAGIHFTQFLIAIHLLRSSRLRDKLGTQPAIAADETTTRVAPSIARAFLRMAWIANPAAFIATNVAVPTIPTIAKRFDLSPTWAGIFCSVWLFARAGAFLLFWKWPGWHYRLGWLLAGYIVMVISFAAILVGSNLVVLLVAQVFFGLALGLLYYSSLYYSMHVGVENQGEHGGMHEAVIGAGNFAGPVVGALALYFYPANPHAGTWAVSVAMGVGLIWMLRVWALRR